jgi:hypothetical protein
VLVTLSRPPAPLLHDIAGALVQTAQGLVDAGGGLHLLYSSAPGGPYDPLEDALWVEDYNWGVILYLDPGYYVALETGNGVAYAGDSPLSNEYHRV